MFRVLFQKATFVLFSLSVGSVALADHHKSKSGECVAPSEEVSVPDGAVASRDEMLDAKDGVQTFVSQGEMYVDCIEKSIDGLRADVEALMKEGGEEKSAAQAEAEEKYRALVQMHDEVVSEMQKIAGEFNEALKAYNENAD